jgi:ribosomal protein L7/L12
LHEVQQKLDALLKHQGIVMPPREQSDMSPELQIMAREPSQKIAAIKRYREENSGTGLADAKARIEEFAKNGR